METAATVLLVIWILVFLTWIGLLARVIVLARRGEETLPTVLTLAIACIVMLLLSMVRRLVIDSM